jgi:hypothetical protein
MSLLLLQTYFGPYCYYYITVVVVVANVAAGLEMGLATDVEQRIFSRTSLFRKRF